MTQVINIDQNYLALINGKCKHPSAFVIDFIRSIALANPTVISDKLFCELQKQFKSKVVQERFEESLLYNVNQTRPIRSPKIVDPCKPKKALTAFNFFVKTEKSNFDLSLPQGASDMKKQGRTMRVAAKCWSELNTAATSGDTEAISKVASFFEMAEADKVRYTTAMDEYSNLSDDEKQIRITEFNQERIEKRNIVVAQRIEKKRVALERKEQLKAEKKAAKEASKKPMTSWAIHMKQTKDKYNGEYGGKKFMELVKADWVNCFMNRKSDCFDKTKTADIVEKYNSSRSCSHQPVIGASAEDEDIPVEIPSEPEGCEETAPVVVEAEKKKKKKKKKKSESEGCEETTPVVAEVKKKKKKNKKKKVKTESEGCEQ